MKLAEALLLRADQEKKVASLRERIVKYAMVQKGDKPAEEPETLLREAYGVMAALESLVVAINRTNLRAKIKDGRTLTGALAARDTLISKHSLLAAAVASSRRDPERYGTKEIKWVATLNVAKLQRQADDLSGKIRELNVLIQEANWREELAELD